MYAYERSNGNANDDRDMRDMHDQVQEAGRPLALATLIFERVSLATRYFVPLPRKRRARGDREVDEQTWITLSNCDFR